MAFCAKCGYQNADGSIYCSRCGSAMTGGTGAAAGPTVVVVGNQASQPTGSNPGTVWLWLNIILFVLTGCVNPLGIVGIIFGGIAISRYNKCLVADAKSKANVAKWMFWIGLILSVLVLVFSLIFGGIGIILTFLGGILPFLAEL